MFRAGPGSPAERRDSPDGGVGQEGPGAEPGERRPLRRSFLRQVIGGIGLAAFAQAVPARALQTDADTGPNADPPRPPRSTITDADTGPSADTPRPAPSSRRYTGVTDRDAGPNADPRGYGRRTPPRQRRR